jgi:hypothetical protein
MRRHPRAKAAAFVTLAALAETSCPADARRVAGLYVALPLPPSNWMPNAAMQQIHLHRTAGRHKSNVATSARASSFDSGAGRMADMLDAVHEALTRFIHEGKIASQGVV